MGPTQGKELSPQMRDRVLKLFARFDVDGSKSIEKSETIKYWKSNFAKLNTEELFKSVDTDIVNKKKLINSIILRNQTQFNYNSGTISEEEWLNFWTSVLRSGHTEEDIADELESIESGSSWVKFENLDKKQG